MQTLSAYHQGKQIDNFTYQITDTPCENLITQNVLHIEKDLKATYPKAKILKKATRSFILLLQKVTLINWLSFIHAD